MPNMTLRGLIKVFLIYSSASICCSLEETEREIYLRPRNFNPHPYQAGYEREIQEGKIRGPVLFPRAPPDPNDANGNFVRINGNEDNRVLFDSHPYTSLTRKYKNKQAGRFINPHHQENHSNFQALKALTTHAEKLLKKPPLLYVNPQYSQPQERNIYAFSYKVQDQQSGDDFSHVQRQNSKATNGEYRVKLPDGRLQIVSYVADKNGYKADVKYTQEEHQTERGPQNPPKNYDYPTNAPEPLYLTNYQTANYESQSINKAKLFEANISPTPIYENQLQINPYLIRLQDIPRHKVELFGNYHHDKHKIAQISENSFNNDKVERFIGSTLAPYILDSSKSFHDNALSTIEPNLQQYNQFRIHSPPLHYLNHKILYQK